MKTYISPLDSGNGIVGGQLSVVSGQLWLLVFGLEPLAFELLTDHE